MRRLEGMAKCRLERELRTGGAGGSLSLVRRAVSHHPGTLRQAQRDGSRDILEGFSLRI